MYHLIWLCPGFGDIYYTVILSFCDKYVNMFKGPFLLAHLSMRCSKMNFVINVSVHFVSSGIPGKWDLLSRLSFHFSARCLTDHVAHRQKWNLTNVLNIKCRCFKWSLGDWLIVH